MLFGQNIAAILQLQNVKTVVLKNDIKSQIDPEIGKEIANRREKREENKKETG